MAVGDYDGDGKDDIYFCNQLGKNALYHNKGDGTFEEVAEKLGVALGDRVSVAAAFVDYDNSGHQSLFVTSTRGGNVLFHNKGDGVFEDVTEQVGLKYEGHSQAALFFDYDNDGYLDLLLTNTAEWTTQDKDDRGHHFLGVANFGDLIGRKKEKNILYHNEPADPNDPSKGRKFVKMPERAGLNGRGWTADAVAFDYDGDGLMDVFVTCMFGRCQLYHNKGNGTFEEVTAAVVGKTPFGGIGCNLFDSKNDGQLALFVTDMHSDMWMNLDRRHIWEEDARRWQHKKFGSSFGPLAEQDPTLLDKEAEFGRRYGYDPKELIFGNGLYQNDGHGKFQEVSDAAGMETLWPWGSAAGDFVNNGREDVFITAGMGYPFWYWPNALMMNKGNGTFTDGAEQMGIEPLPRGQFLEELPGGHGATRSSRCAATGDFFGDGRLAIVVNNFNDQPYFYKNQAPAKNWIEFRLTGGKHKGGRCNRDAIGAVVRLYRGKTVMTRQVKVSGGYLAQSSKTLHFGLGNSKDFDRVEITWPGRRHPQVLTKVNVNAINPIDEPDDDTD